MTLSPYQKHKKLWENCGLCPLCDTRTHVVLARGNVPAQILFIGEAPGSSEDVLGKPFVGPAGKLLDEIVRRADVGATTCFTNLVACIPLGDEGEKTTEPPVESIEKCAPRLLEFFQICRPQLVVCVGSLATKWVPKILAKDEWYRDQARIDLVHPAAILRADVTQRGLMVQRCVVTLAEAAAEL